MAIENQLADAGDGAFSLIDLSEVTVLDFSCADEVVAKLLLRYLDADRPLDAYFVILGLGDLHREPIEAVLERQRLATVARRSDGTYELVGVRSPAEDVAWRVVETRGLVRREQLPELFPSVEERAALDALVQRRLVFDDVRADAVHALSRLAARPA
jgi:hypothetical protein